MNDPQVTIALKRFLLIEACPEAWKGLDLYIIRDDEVVFYVGQSQLAFSRVWEHLLGGFKGHSLVGRFVWSNWPTSVRFTIDLLSSQSEPFKAVGYNVDAAEQLLIRQRSPCFNVAHNKQPTPIPSRYRPANARLRFRGGLRRLLYEAERAVRLEDNRLLVE